MIPGKLVSMEQLGGRAGRGDETGQQEVEGREELDEKTPRSRSETEREKRGIREKEEGKKIAAKNAELKSVCQCECACVQANDSGLMTRCKIKSQFSCPLLE